MKKLRRECDQVTQAATEMQKVTEDLLKVSSLPLLGERYMGDDVRPAYDVVRKEYLDRRSRQPQEVPPSDITPQRIGTDERQEPIRYIRSHYSEELALLRRRGKLEAEEHEAMEFHLARAQLPPSYYRFCGECYVHGVMNGEAIALQNIKLGSGEMEQQMFELR
jgi:hypothetical protein